MKSVKFAAFAAGLLAMAATGPAAEAQTVAVAPRAAVQARVQPRVEPRVQVFGSQWAEIGVSIRDVDGTDAKGSASGVVVTDVVKDGPAEKAGVKNGDVFVEFDGERVRSARQFTRLVQETAVGRKVAAAVLRDGQRVSLTLEPRSRSPYRLLGDFENGRLFERLEDLRDMIPPPPPAAPAPPAPPAPGAPPAPPAPPTPARPGVETFIWRGSSALGITTSELSSQLAEYFGVKDGVLVNSVTANSAAARAGVKAGDVVTSVNGKSVTSPSELRREVQRLDDGAEFTIGVMRDKKSLTLKGKLEPRGRNTWTFRS